MKTRFLAVPLVLVGAAAVAHVGFVVKGVHFKSQPIDFGQPPMRRGDYFDEGTGMAEAAAWRPGTKFRHALWDEYEESDEARDKRRTARYTSLMRDGAKAESLGKFDSAREFYNTLRKQGLGDPAFVNARAELFDTPGIAGQRGLTAYLKATHPLSHGPLPTNVGPLLKPWVAYSKARSAADYATVARSYSGSSRAAAALIMAARMEVNVPDPGAIQGGIGRARRWAETLLRNHPESRFAWDAHGILGRLDYLQSRYPAAVEHYEGQVRTANTPERKANALQSILLCYAPANRRDALAYAALRWTAATDSTDPYPARSFLLKTLERFNGADARNFYARLAKDPASYASYLELRASLDPKASDVLNLAEAARRATAGTPSRASVDATLARVALTRGDGRVRQFALDAQKGRGDDEAVGTFVLATLNRRSGRLAEARAGYRRLLAQHPNSYLAGGAKENLALVSERLGEYGAALEIYRDLGYDQDIAYLTDVRMTPAQLATYVARHPKDDSARYTLAMRYLRRREWDAAEAALKPLSDATRRRITSAYVWPETAKSEGGLQDPLVTLRALRALDTAVKASKGEPRAAALAAMGDYYYTHKTLLLYSGPAWRGMRDAAVSFSWNTAVATPNDETALRAHYDEHECYAQALRLYRQVLKESPDSKVAGHAAYRGAVVAQRLARMAPYWRWRERNEDRMGEAVRLMTLASNSPDAEIARKAKKYGPVFAQERGETRRAFSEEKAPARRWNPF